MAILGGIKRTGRIFPALLVAVLALGLPVGFVAQEQDEYEVKAAFLFNFSKFMEWPQSSASGNFEICILGDNPFETALDQLTKGKVVNGRPIQVRRIKDPTDARPCQIAFASSAERVKAAKLVDAVRGAAVLTVGETPEFLRAGGMIALSTDGNHVDIVINDNAIQGAGIKVSAKLMLLAKKYKSE